MNKQFRPIPFWSWNDKLEPQKLIEQIRWMNANGIGGFFMHARSGLQTEYLSEEWMQCIESCAEEAQKLDMKAWIYDENGWPSGFVGGKLLEDEGNRDKYILATEGDYDEEATISYFLSKERLVRVSAKQEEKGRYLNLYIHTSVSSADILNPQVVDKFLALTHEKYREHFGDKFSEQIEGFFTDEPQYYRLNTPYTDVIAQYYRDTYGEDIFDQLGLLFVEKKGYRTFRYRYWKAMQTLMLENFAKRVYTWCDENSVKLTGHYVEESTMGLQMMCCGGVMPFYEYEHIPGIDWLWKLTESPLAPRQVASVAAQLGKKRVLTETFGACGWDIKLSELRRIVGFQYVNGVNMMCHHLMPYSERGSRKYDYPAHYSDINPWVKESFQTFNEYYTQVGSLLGEGKQHVNVAMLHPIRSTYLEYKRECMDAGAPIHELDGKLLFACNTLSARGIEYHFLDETLLAKYGFVEDGRIGCGKCAYDYLVLPKMITMDKATEVLLRKFVTQGGKVLLLNEKPTYLEGDKHAYDYLESNVTLDEICAGQKYSVKDFNTDIYSTYRIYDGEEFLYVMNNSIDKTETQTFEFRTAKKAITVTLKPGEDALLCMDDMEYPNTKELTSYTLQFTSAPASVKENYLPIDYIRYSTDGEHYSKPWPCPALFQKLLRERYQGEIFLRYEFDVKTIPESLYLRAEKSNDIAAWFNEKPLIHTIPTKEAYVNIYDVTNLIHEGTNVYTVQIDWFENKNVYYALFGENVTESLKNCLVYDTELQPIELVGRFGVYPRDGYKLDKDERFVRGEGFYIGTLPECVTEPTTEGFPFLAGEMTLCQKVYLDTANILLQVAGEYQMAFVKVNGMEAGKLFFDTELDISHVAKQGENEIEVRFILSNRNRMGPHHLVESKDEPASPFSFELSGTWEEDSSLSYHADYDLKKFYVKSK